MKIFLCYAYTKIPRAWSYLRKSHAITFCSSCKKAETCLSVINPWLGTLECKPIDGCVNSRTSAPLDDTDLEAACCDIFNPNRSRIVYLWWFVSKINRCKNSHRSSTGEVVAKWHMCALKSIISNLLNAYLPNFNAWNRNKGTNNCFWRDQNEQNFIQLAKLYIRIVQVVFWD